MGVGEAAEPKGGHRSLKLTKSTVAFGIGVGRPNARPITKIEEAREDPILRSAMGCRDWGEGRDGAYSFSYDPRKDGTVRLDHRPQIAWTKERW